MHAGVALVGIDKEEGYASAPAPGSAVAQDLLLDLNEASRTQKSTKGKRRKASAKIDAHVKKATRKVQEHVKKAMQKHVKKAMQKVQRKQDKLAKKFGVSPAGPPRETVKRMRKAIKYVGTRVHHPEWVIMDLGRNGHSHQVLGVVKCPCASEKKPLTEKDARKRILGQVC